MRENVFNQINTLKKIGESIQSHSRLCIRGAHIGEKVLGLYMANRAICVCSDVVTQSALKHGLEALNKKVSTLSYGMTAPIFSHVQENGDMQSFISAILDFALGKVDYLLILGETLLQRLPNDLASHYFSLKEKQSISLETLSKKLVTLGYKRQNMVSAKGDFAIRGDIVDIFLVNEDLPIRIDFFGDDIERIYSFDVDTTKFIEQKESVDIDPGTIYFLENKNIFEKLNDEIKKIKINENNYSKINDIISHYSLCFSAQNLGCGDSFILPFFEFENNIISLFSNDNIFIDEPKKINDELNILKQQNLMSINKMIDANELLNIHKKFYYDIENIKLNSCVFFDNFSANNIVFDEEIDIRTIGTRKYVFDYRALVSDINIYLSSSYRVFLFCGSKSNAQNIEKFLLSNNLSYSTDIEDTRRSQVYVFESELEHSASFLNDNVILIGTSDLVKRQRRQPSTKKSSSLYLPKVGDYCVHAIHGIGKCIATEKLNLNGYEKDYFILQYKNNDILYVPSEQADLISAYLGSDKEPTLNKLGGAEFARVKERVKNSLKQLAIDLVNLYSERQKLKGYKYDAGNYLFDEFENAFEYELTSDQAQAIEDIKNDMTTGKLMDRLICGDVGYGKTEVALRAAYLAVLSGKQVAFLCPTTILSEQHFSTVKKRMNNFGCRVAVINRFKNSSQIKQTLKELKDGNIDILVGTHRLLSGDVVFKDLGLLILDEEHRFGVEDKEKIKNLKKDVDVLSLSATPIPRTLNMALSGIRDISVIETPPKNRVSVKTYVVEQSDALIVDAVKREISRDGQVFIVYNRVEHINEFCQHIRSLMPNLRIGLAHGQMPKNMLEDVIFKLYDGQYDVLVATTLIENGIDIPSANTLIVIDADKLGLSQLYQLKGRIGRSDKLAYAYFTFNPNKVLSVDAYKRLDAILEFTELGSGYKIAMRDLEIRGAGNVLGKQQHGHMEKVGYDMYVKLLKESINEIRGQKVEKVRECKMDISCPAYLDENYIADSEERIKQYAKISKLESKEELQSLENETQQAYGKLPRELIYLYKIALLKNLMIKMGAKKLLLSPTKTQIYLYKEDDIVGTKVIDILNKNKDIAVLKFEDVPIIELNLGLKSIDDKLEFLINFTLDAIKD